MAGRYFTGLTSGISQKFFHSKQEDTQSEGLQELLSHLQHKPNPSLQSLGNEHPKSNVIESQPEATTPVLGGAKLEDEDLFVAEDSGWGINDDDLIIEPLENQPVEDKKEIAPIRKESLHERKDLEEERKSTTPERKYSQNLDKSEKNSKTPSMDLSNTKAPNRHSAKGSAKYTPLQQITSKASNFISEIGKIGKISKAEQQQPTSGGKVMKKTGGPSASDKYKVADPFGFEEVLHRLTVDPTSRNEPQPRKTEGEEIKGRDSHSYFGNEDEHSQRLREQMQKYMAQAHQLEILVREEQDIMHEEHTKKIRNVQTLEEEANIRLEECQKKEKELRTLDEKIKLKQELNIDENRLEEMAKQREETQERISQLEEKNQFLEFTLKNDKEKLQQEMEEKLNTLREESQRQLQQREQELVNNYEQIIKQQTDSFNSEITSERNRYNRLAKKVKDWASAFQSYKGSFKNSLMDIEQMLWTKGEEFEAYTHKTKEIHDKVVQVTNSYKVRLDQKDHQAAKHIEIEKGLKEELDSISEEKNRIITEKEKEIKELKAKLNKLEAGYEIEKDNVLMLQTKFDEASMKMHTSEQMAKTFEKEKNELKKNLETEKKNSAALQAKLDELSKKGKDSEGSLKNLEKSNADLKKELEAEKKKNKTLQTKLDETSSKEKTTDEKYISLQKKKEELERALEDEKGRSMALQLTLDETSLADKNKERRIKTLEKDKSDLEEKYLKELKDLKGENYRSEESYLQEIEKLTAEMEELKKEIERLNSSGKDSPSKLGAFGKTSRKKSDQEAQRKIHELTDQIDNMNKEKIQLGERFKRDKAELIEGYDQRFKSLNMYIEELYTKNHQLTEENTLLNGKFNQLKDKLTALDSSFKNLAAQSHDHTHKNELNQLLAHLELISEAPKDSNEPISPQLRAELQESLRQETEKRAPSPTFNNIEGSNSRRNSPTLKVTPPQIDVQEGGLKTSEGNLLVTKSPTIKDLIPVVQTEKEYEAPNLLEGNVRMPESWGNMDVLIPGKTNEDNGERAKSAFDRTQQPFSSLQTGGKVESANAVINTGGVFREDELPESPKFSRPGSAVPLELQASSPEFKGSTESPRFESVDNNKSNHEEGRLTPVDPEKLDLDSPTFQGRKLGDFVEEGPEKDSAELGEASLLRVSSTPKGERRDSALFKSMEKMKEIKMSMSSRRDKSNETFSNKSNSPGIKSKEASPVKSNSESPKFGTEKSFHEENSKQEKEGVSPLVQEGQWGLDDLDVNLENVEAPLIEEKQKEEEIVEPLMEDPWGGDVKIEENQPVKEEEVVEPLVDDAWGGGIQVEEQKPAEENVEPLVDDAWGGDVQIEENQAEEEETGVTAWDTNIDFIESPAVQTAQNKSPFVPAKKTSSPLAVAKKSSASPLKEEKNNTLEAEIDFGGASAWDTNIDFIQSPAVENKSPAKKTSSPLVAAKKSSASPLKQEPKVDFGVESAWDTNIDFTEPPTIQNKSPAKKISSPLKESAGWDVGVDLDINLGEQPEPEPKLSPAKESAGSGKKEFESSPSMKNSSQNAGEGSERGSMSQLDSKVSLGSSITKSTGKLTVPNVFDFSGKKTGASGTKGTEEKKKGGLVINKIVLPKKGTTGGKINLGKAKEDKDDVDLEEFLGTSMK